METTYAKIVKGIVDNIEVVTDEFVAANPERYKNHAKVKGIVGKGYAYGNKVFTSPQPYPSWLLIDNIWQPPKPKPEGNYYWNEVSKNWIKEQV